MKIFLVRHGETKENLAGIFQGHNHGILSEQGIKQAQKLSHRLADKNFDIIFSSDLNRALDTAQIILKLQPNAIIKISPLLRETNLGDFTGTKVAEADWKNPPKNVESRINVRNRFLDFLKNVTQNFSDKKILIVSHSGTIAAGLSYFLNLPCDETLQKIIKQNNTALNIFYCDKNLNGEIKLINNTDHLL